MPESGNRGDVWALSGIEASPFLRADCGCRLAAAQAPVTPHERRGIAQQCRNNASRI
jgi:hypothetical protein